MNTRCKQREDICRICRQKCSKCLPISDKLEGFEDLTIEKGLEICCGVQLRNTNETPWNLCDLCVDELKITYIFLEKFKESEKFYKNQIASKNIEEIEKIEFLDGYEQDVIQSNLNDDWDEIPIEESLVPEEDSLAINIKDITTNNEPFVYKGITIKKPSKKTTEEVQATRPRRSTVSKKTYIEYEVSTPEADDDQEDFVIAEEKEASDTEESLPPPEQPKKKRPTRKEKPLIPFIRQKQSDLDIELEGNFAVEVDGKVFHKCNKCSKMFPKLGSLRSHIKFVHLKIREWLCSMCPKMFVSKLRLEEHFRSHTGVRPYKCEFCPMAFATPTRKKLHMLIHTGENPNVCNFCGKRFASYATLMGHKFIHTKKGVECTVCKKHFARAVDVKKHMAVHTQEKSFICKICGKGYLYATSLKSHMRNHVFENVTCKSCGDLVSSLTEWNYHQQLHAKEIYECNNCGVTFIEQHELYAHLRTAHVDEEILKKVKDELETGKPVEKEEVPALKEDIIENDEIIPSEIT